MNRSHFLTIGCFVGLFAVLYFGCDIKSKEHKDLEKSRAMKFELLSIDRVIGESKVKLNTGARTQIQQLEQQLKNAKLDSQKVQYYKSLASIWFSEDIPLVSGHYAEKIAEIEESVDAWSIAGTTYSIAGQRLEAIEKEYAIGKSRTALEKALSMEPENIDNKINLALSYVEAPLEDNPMKGILMLVKLNQKHPENVPVLMQLARLSIKTGQFDKAVVRLTKVIELRPTFRDAHCMLSEVYNQKGETEKAKESQIMCDNKLK